jgi:hypothetical protein
MAAAPAFDCTGAAAVAVDGDHVTMNVSGMAVSGELNVAVVPASATDRLAFEKPGADALAMGHAEGGVAPGAGGGADPAEALDAAASTPTLESALLVPTPALTFDAAPLPTPAPAPAQAQSSDSRPLSALERAAAAAPLGSTPSGAARPWAVALLVGAAGAAALLWFGAGARAARLPVDGRPTGLGGR